jgi:Ser/Thr protein kinase RdoA (MazF antagonist)/4-aminobutyrate aminotransferase-like enzyme
MPDAAPEPEVPYDSVSDDALDRVNELLRDHWGLSGQVFPVGDDEGTGFLVDNGHLRYLLEIRPPQDEPELRLQHEAMRHIIRDPDGPPVPEPVATREGTDIVTAPIDGEARLLRLLTALEGEAPPVSGALSPDASAALGSLVAGLAKSLEDFDAPSIGGDRDDDLRKAGPQAVSLLSEVQDQDARDMIARAMVAALRRVHPLSASFRVGLTVPDLALDNLVGQGEGLEWQPTGISDIGGLSRHWYVAALAKACARILGSNGPDGDPFAILPAVAAYNAVNPLNAGEAEALWPLVIAQLALLAAIAENRHAVTPHDAAAAGLAEERRGLLSTAGSVSAAFMHASVANACGIELDAPELGTLLPDADPERIRLVDLGVSSPLLHDGNWTDPDCDWKLLARVAWDTGMGSTRYGEYRLSRASTEDADETDTFALHVDVCLPAGTRAAAPFAGVVRHISSMLSLRGKDVTLFIEGIAEEPADGTEVQAGDAIGIVAGAENSVGGLRIRLSRDPETPPPLFCRPSEAAVWRHLAPSPSALLGLDCNAPPAAPRRIARAWHEFLFDETGNSLLDVSGRAPMIGHGHPDVAAAAYRQHLLIATSPEGQAEADALKQALAEIAPSGLDRVVLFPDARSAIEALTALAKEKLGRKDDITEDDDGEAEAAEPETGEAELGENNVIPDRTVAIIDPLALDADLAARAAAAREDGHLVVLDERRTGYGRLAAVMWAAERDDIVADIVLAGSLDGGELAVAFCAPEFFDALEALAAPVSPLSAATARAALKVFGNEGLREKAAAAAGILADGLLEIAERARDTVDLKGSGLVWTMQLSGDSRDFRDRLDQGAIHGADGPTILQIAPPLAITEKSAARYLSHLRRAFGLVYE